MNRISLTLKSRTLEKEYHSQQITAIHRKLQIILVTYLAIGTMNLINLSVDYLNREGKDDDEFIGSQNYKISLGFLIAWMASVVMNLVLLHLVPHKINIYYTMQHLINVVYHLILIKFEINVTEGTLPSQSSSSNDNQRIQFHVQEGFFLAIIIFRGMIGTKFLLKVLITTIAIISLLIISYSQQEKPYIQIPFGLACLFLAIYQMYQDDREKRSDFLMRRKDEEWNKIIKNVLPTNLIIAKYNFRESRIELELANRKANKELNITDSENFQAFAHQTLVQKNEIISNEKDLHRILKINKNTNGIANTSHVDSKLNASIQVSANGSNNNGISSNNNLVGNAKKEVKNTLYQLIRSRIDEEMKNRRRTNALGVVPDSEQDNDPEQLPSKQQQRRRQSISANPGVTSSKKVSEYIGTHISNGFDVDKKLLIRVSTFSLNEAFAVITIENETYREKYIKQIKFSTFLEKIFSFQLRKFKESYQVVLNELNRISNTEVQNQLLYHNVKCMNRVNSYLQYFEFKNAQRHEFAVTQFSLSGEIFKILNSLRHYIAGKRVRTFYENTTNITTISSDEERLQQIFFMIFEHLLVNAPPDGYIAIRITNDRTISNCFKVQIQSTYDSQLLNSISLQTFNIDELYNDYEIYQNYFVSLRIAIKLITLMGPYSKIDFSRSENNILFTSFSIFSDLEVIKKQQDIRPQTNLPNQSIVRSQTNIPSHLIESPSNNFPASNYQSEQASFMKQSGGKKLKGQTSFKRLTPQNVSEFHAFSQNNIINDNESANLSEVYDEEHSFNQWFKLKLMQHSTISNQKVLLVKSGNNNAFNLNSNVLSPVKIEHSDSLPFFVPQFAPSVEKPLESQAHQSEATFPSEQNDAIHNSLISLPNQPDTLTFEGESIFHVNNFSPVCDVISTQLTSKQAIFNEMICKKNTHSSHSLVLSSNQKDGKDKDYSQIHKITRKYNKSNSQLLHQTLPLVEKQFKNMSTLKNKLTKKPSEIDRNSLHFASCNDIPSNQDAQELLEKNNNKQVAELEK